MPWTSPSRRSMAPASSRACKSGPMKRCASQHVSAGHPTLEREHALPLHHSTWVDELQFIDHRALEWEHVRRVRYFCCQRFYYDYPGAVRNLHHHLIVVPRERYGDQELVDHRFTVTPYPAAA